MTCWWVCSNEWLYGTFTAPQPVYRALWKANRDFLADEFASFVDTLIESIPLSVPNDQVARFNAELAKIQR